MRWPAWTLLGFGLLEFLYIWWAKPAWVSNDLAFIFLNLTVIVSLALLSLSSWCGSGCSGGCDCCGDACGPSGGCKCCGDDCDCGDCGDCGDDDGHQGHSH